MQHRCRIEVVEKYTSKLFHRSQTNVPNSHFPANSTDALNDIAHNATNMSAIWNENVRTDTHTYLLEYLVFECCGFTKSTYRERNHKVVCYHSAIDDDVKAFESILKSLCPMTATATASATTISGSSVSETKYQWK